MSKVLVSGYYGFNNAGDEAMLMAMLEAFRDGIPGVQVAVLSRDPERTEQEHHVFGVPRANLFAIRRWVKWADLIVSGGGGLLQDVTGSLNILYYLGIVALGLWYKKPVMLYGHGIGPVRARVLRLLVRLVCDRVNLITVRDQASLRELQRMGIRRPSMHVTADPVLGLGAVPDPDGQGARILAGWGVSLQSPVIGISPRKWGKDPSQIPILASVCDHLCIHLGAQVVFCPMQFPEDLEVSKEIASHMKRPAIIIDRRLSVRDLMWAIGAMDLMLGVRLHGLILASMMGVPVVGISYDPKVDAFLESLGEKPASHMDDLAIEDILVAIEKVWANRKENGLRLAGKVKSLTESARESGRFACELLAKGQG